MTEALTTAIEAAAEEVAAVTDPVERYHRARTIRAQLLDADHHLKAIQQAVAVDLKAGRTWAQVGEALGVTGSRAEALAKGR
jgi:hypothetical protein